MFRLIKNNFIPSVIVALIVIGFIVGIGSAISGGGFFTAGNINKGLVGYWPLDGSGGGAEATVNLAPNPYFMDATLGANATHVNSGWGSSTLLKIESITGPLGGTVQAFTEELISYTSEAHMEGAQSEISSGGTNTLTLTAGQTYEISIYVKATANDSSSNLLYITGVSGSQSSSSMSVTTEWTRISRSFTPTVTGSHALRHYFYNAAVGFKIYYTGLQIELKDHITPFVDGTRLDRVADNSPSSNHGDIYGAEVRNHGYSFTTGNNIDAGNISLDAAGEMTLSFWVKPEATASGHEIAIGNADNNTNAGFSFSHYLSGAWYFYHANDTWSLWTAVPTAYQHVVLQIKKGVYKKAYRNGVLYNTNSSIGTQSLDSGNFIIGNGGGLLSANAFHGNIADVRLYNSILTATEILDLYNGANVGSPIGQWNLDTGSKDSSGNNNHGTVTGASLIGEAALFNGTSDYIDLGDVADLDFGDGSADEPFSVGAWVNMTDSTNFKIASKDYQWVFQTQSNDLFGLWLVDASTGGAVGGYKVGDISALQGQLHHYAATYDGSTSYTGIKLYIDGVEFAATNNSSGSYTAMEPTGNNGYIGRYTTSYSNGLISHVRIYDRALSEADIQTIYNQGGEGRAVTQISTKSKGLIGHWELDKDSENVGINLVANPHLDTSSASWTSYQMTRTWNASYGWSGGGARYAWDNTTHGVIETSYVTTIIGKRYVMSMKFKADVNNDFDYSSTSALSAFTFKTGGAAERGKDYSSIEITSLGDGWYQWTRQFTATGDTSGLIYAYKPGVSIPRNVFVDDGYVREVQTVDSTPNGNNGIVHGTSYTTDRKGQANGAMSFDGVDEYIEIPDSTLLDITGDMTISAWSKLTGNTAYTLVSKRDTSDYTAPYQLWYGTGSYNYRPAFNLGEGSSAAHAQSSTDYNDGAWHHIVGTISGDNVKIFVDGIEKGSDIFSGTRQTNNESLKIGRYSSVGSYYTGNIQDVRFYDRALSLAEIQGLYDSYKPKIAAGSLYKGLVGSWSLKSKDEKVGAVIESDTFEAGTEGWGKFDYSGSSTVQSRDNTVYKNGSYSLKSVVTAGTGTYPAIWDLFTALTNGKTYRASMWIKADSNKTANFRVDTNSGLDSGSPAFNVSKSITTDWQHIEQTFTPAGSSYIKGGIRYYSSSYGNATFWIDDWKIHEINTADTTPYANHGVVYGATIEDDYSTFNGSSDYIMLPSNLLPNIFTISIWVNFDDTSNTRFFGVESGSITDDLVLQISNGNFQIFNDEAYTLTTANPFTPGSWYNIIFDTSGNCYINGISIASSLDISKTSSGLGIGVDGIDLGEVGYFDGKMSNIKIYNRVLTDGTGGTPDEIQMLYDQGH